jgi:hypothetical protein
VLCLEDVMADCIAYVQLPIQAVTVDQPLDKKQVKLPLCVTRTNATLFIRKSATLCYT